MTRNSSSYVDWFATLLYVLLLVIGWGSILGASYDFGQTDILAWNTLTGKQLVWIVSALLLGGAILLLDRRLFEDYSVPLYIVMLIVLVATIFIAKDIKGSRSWLAIGSFTLQPAEFAKCATALALARVMSRYGFTLRNKKLALLCAMIIALPMIAIIGEQETGSAIVFTAFMLMLYREGMSGIILLLGILFSAYFLLNIRFGADTLFHDTTPMGIFISLSLALLSAIVMIKLYVPKAKVRTLMLTAFIVLHGGMFLAMWEPAAYNVCLLVTALLVAIGLWLIWKWLNEHSLPTLLIGLFALFSTAFIYSSDYTFANIVKPHQQVRIRIALGMEDDPSGAGYNVQQSLIAIGSGGLSGKGFLNGTQTKLKYVPEQETDFIFCTIGEEEGFLGATLVLLIFVVLILRIMKIAERGDTFQRVYGYCVASILTFHVLVNIGMVLGLTPVIGIPLPFISYGGSSLWGFTILLFILLRIDKSRH